MDYYVTRQSAYLIFIRQCIRGSLYLFLYRLRSHSMMLQKNFPLDISLEYGFILRCPDDSTSYQKFFHVARSTQLAYLGIFNLRSQITRPHRRKHRSFSSSRCTRQDLRCGAWQVYSPERLILFNLPSSASQVLREEKN